jgi:EpsD family peptidyl-prolyl cis-trans isomerase
MCETMRIYAKILLPLLISACSGDSEHKASQVVAKVNQDEISIHQVNFQLSRLGKVPEENGKEVAGQVLTKLVDQQLLKQQALANKLDRDPRVLQFIEASKNEILAQAYLERVASKATKPDDKQIDDFYVRNPELFEQRRIFRLQELIVNVGQDKQAEIEAVVSGRKNIGEIADWLKTQPYPITANINVRVAEQLPLELLKKLQPLQDGELLVVKNPQSINILHLVGSQSAPISKESAAPMINQYLLNVTKTELVKKEVSTLQSGARVEYLGSFAELGKKKELDTIKSDLAPSIKETTEKAKKQTDVVGSSISELDKGLSGL